jgi:hypothetical protein
VTRAWGARPRAALTAVVVSGLVMAFATGCGHGSPGPPPTVASGPPSALVTPTPTATAGPRFDASGLDLCKRTDTTPLESLSLAVESTDDLGPGTPCMFQLRPRERQGILIVRAITPPSADQAKRDYQSTQSDIAINYPPDGALTGVGEEAEGFTSQGELPSGSEYPKYSNYVIIARLGNLVVQVTLGVGDKAFTPKPKLVAVARAITQGTIRLVPKA